ncbi:Diguanylate cyclase, GGDEF domain [uncultured archaeon]|nr:Diguanylate cyclase, GGDEF domain [uncultured archaeon]
MNEINDLNIFELLDLERRLTERIVKKTKSSEIKKLLDIHKKVLSRLSDYAIKDPLTGLLNRNGYVAILQGLIKEGFENGRDFSHVLFDADHFKRVNDAYGHDVGDKVLKLIARVICQGINQPSYSGSYAAILHGENPIRIGGEEIVVISPNADAPKGYDLADKLRENIENSFNSQRELPSITVSGGLATFDGVRRIICPMETNYSWEEIANAIYVFSDSALYLSKEKGRNRISTLDDILLAQLSPEMKKKLGNLIKSVLDYKKE